MAKLYEVSLWVYIAVGRMLGAVRAGWKRILVGALAGAVFAVFGGAVALAWLEIHGLVTRTTADELGIILVLYGIGAGALFAYAIRPVAAARAD